MADEQERTGLTREDGYTNSYTMAIRVLRDDADVVEGLGFIARADCYRHAADELEKHHRSAVSVKAHGPSFATLEQRRRKAEGA